MHSHFMSFSKPHTVRDWTVDGVIIAGSIFLRILFWCHMDSRD